MKTIAQLAFIVLVVLALMWCMAVMASAQDTTAPLVTLPPAASPMPFQPGYSPQPACRCGQGMCINFGGSRIYIPPGHSATIRPGLLPWRQRIAIR